jgi:hypothetical protein
MLTVIRKKTGKRIGRVPTEAMLELFLSVLPIGVYGVEDNNGNEITVATVKGGRVKFAGAVPVVPVVTVSPEVLAKEGYTEVAGQDGRGEVTLRNDQGGLEVFAIRDSYAGWSVPTDQGKVLEFCRSIQK